MDERPKKYRIRMKMRMIYKYKMKWTLPVQ
jgi:hypothetical protein